MRVLELRGYLDLPAEARSVATARHQVGALLHAAGFTEIDEVLLLLSELVSNAVRHSDSARLPGGEVTVAVSTTDDLIHVDVIDAGSPTPLPLESPAHVDELSENGRGLWLVSELSASWGCKEEAQARVVWFELKGHRAEFPLAAVLNERLPGNGH